MNLLETAFSQDIVEACISRGIDKEMPHSILLKFCKADFRANLIQRIESGEYKLSPPALRYIPKDNGKMREIYVCKPIDRIILSLLNMALDKIYGEQLSPACASYRKGMSCARVVRDIPKPVSSGYKLDLSKYFDSVNQEALNAMLKQLNTGSAADKLLYDFYNDNRIRVDGQLVPRYKSLGQGCATASFLSNYLLRNLDNKMLSMCSYYCRYSDDMLILGPKAAEALEVLKQELAKFGLTLNPDKVEQILPQKEFKFLGFGIAGDAIKISLKDFAAKKHEVRHAVKCVPDNLPPDERLRKAISSVKHIFFNYREPCYGWLYIKALGINDFDRLSELDRYCKDCIRTAVTGSWNYTHNVNKIPNSVLEQCGYVSLVHMAKAAQIDRSFFREEHLLCVQQHMK